MNTRFIICTILLGLIISCDQRKPSQQAAIPDIIMNNVLVSYNDCLPDSINCTYVHILYPEFSDSTKAGINEIISNKIKTIASDYFREDVIHDTFEYIAQSFIEDYKTFKTDFPDYQFGWYVVLASEITFESDQLFSFRIDSESFTGGAHPNSSTEFFVIEKRSGKELSTTDIISDTSQFKEMLEEEFRKEKGMNQEQSFADRGFYINDGDFLLNDNIGLTDTSVLVHFNPYEIAPYSEGATTLEISKKSIGNILKVE